MSPPRSAHPTPVRVGLMDQRRPQEVATVPVRQLTLFERVWRATRRGLLVSGGLLLVGNFALLIIPLPHLHLCLCPVAFSLGPILFGFALRDRVLVGATQLPCPRCREAVTVPESLGGWPARFNCHQCGVMVELNQA